MEQLIAKGVELIQEASEILVFTGAGLGTESGIPDFRSPGGIWDRYDPEDFYFQRIVSDEGCRERYWQMSSEYYVVMKEARPNPAHLAIKTLEDTGKLLSIVTQNIDRLHHRAGNSPDKIIEIHGTAFLVTCLNCGKIYERDEIEDRISAGVKIPYCDDCSGILKPDTISFGQAMPEDKMSDAIMYAHRCDLCIAMGSSLVVYPAASVPEEAVNNGARLMIINRDETPLDRKADLLIHDSVGKTLDRIMTEILKKRDP
ncbi:MAG: Sir2 family NAD-dependent protein deacetylase [Deltaproteobacteria bacterium]|nr:Sir2 family NAD-dependent protein deacetylase [Deltaproteobacteria bacterium]